jgi:hypothetical protein
VRLLCLLWVIERTIGLCLARDGKGDLIISKSVSLEVADRAFNRANGVVAVKLSAVCH